MATSYRLLRPHQLADDCQNSPDWPSDHSSDESSSDLGRQFDTGQSRTSRLPGELNFFHWIRNGLIKEANLNNKLILFSLDCVRDDGVSEQRGGVHSLGLRLKKFPGNPNYFKRNKILNQSFSMWLSHAVFTLVYRTNVGSNCRIRRLQKVRHRGVDARLHSFGLRQSWERLFHGHLVAGVGHHYGLRAGIRTLRRRV